MKYPLLCLYFLSFISVHVLSYQQTQPYTSPQQGNDGYRDEYLKYLLCFKKDMTRLQNQNRLESFTKALLLINAHNADQSKSYNLKLNEFADWSKKELATRFKAWDKNKSKAHGDPLPHVSFDFFLS